MIIGGVVFIIGWAQFKVPSGSYGVIISKTHGVDPHLVRSGEFRWIWYKLIPTNVQIAVFRLDPEKFTVDFNSSLPSGDIYSAFAGIGADFSWELKAQLSFSIDPDKLIQVIKQHNIADQQALDEYSREIAKNIEVYVLRSLISGETDVQRLEKILSGSPDKEMEQQIATLHPEIRDFSFTIQSARFPDFILYRQVRLIYEEFLSKQREFITSAFGQKAQGRIESQLHFEDLERYGELLTKYPVLLEYMALENGGKPK